MTWKTILKTRNYGKKGLSAKDTAMLDYIMKDGMTRTIERIFDDIYDMINKTKKLGSNKADKLQTKTRRPARRRFDGARLSVQQYFTNSPNYESKVVGLNEFRNPIKEFKYVGNKLGDNKTWKEEKKKDRVQDARKAETDNMILSGFKRRADDMIARAKRVRNEAADLYNQDGEFGFEYNMKKLDDAIQEYIKDIEEVKAR